MSSVQMTVNKSFEAELERLGELLGDNALERVQNLANYGIQISPVDTGAWVESFSVGPRGSSGGRSKSREARKNKPRPGAAQAKGVAMGGISEDIAKYKDAIIESGGAVIINRSEEAQSVENDFAVFARMKTRFV